MHRSPSTHVNLRRVRSGIDKVVAVTGHGKHRMPEKRGKVCIRPRPPERAGETVNYYECESPVPPLPDGGPKVARNIVCRLSEILSDSGCVLASLRENNKGAWACFGQYL